MFHSLEIRSIRHTVLLVGVAALLTVTAGALPRAPSSTTIGPREAGIEIPTPIADPSVVLLQMNPIEIPMPILDPFIG